MGIFYSRKLMEEEYNKDSLVKQSDWHYKHLPLKLELLRWLYISCPGVQPISGQELCGFALNEQWQHLFLIAAVPVQSVVEDMLMINGDNQQMRGERLDTFSTSMVFVAGIFQDQIFGMHIWHRIHKQHQDTYPCPVWTRNIHFSITTAASRYSRISRIDI